MCKLAYLQEYTEDNSVVFSLVENPDYKEGKCQYNMKLNLSSIQLDEFQKNNPYTIDGELLFFNNIVIPDTKINLSISFPLEKTKNILISSDSDLGFSLSSLVDKIKKVYKWIYKEEENTCSIKKFNIINQCNCTLNSIDNITNSLLDFVDNEDSNQCSNQCSICLESIDSLTNPSKKTSCNHLYHKDCIYEWINNNKNTCPLCRKKLFTCNNCNNGLIYTEYIGKIIPKNIRGISNRNNTDGVFKIYGYDFEDLFIDEMIYNSVTKTLYPKIFG